MAAAGEFGVLVMRPADAWKEAQEHAKK